MTTPPPGTAPQHDPYQQGYPQQNYPQAPGPYTQQPYGQAPYPPPGVPAAPAGYGVPPAATRPGMVTAAAVLAFIWGGLSIISSLISMAAGSFVSSVSSACDSIADQIDKATGAACAATSSWGGVLIVVGIALIVAAGLLIWGGVVALSGKNGKVLVIAGGLLILIQIFWMIGSGSVAFSIVGIIVPVLIVVFMMNAASKNWIRSKGGSTF